jgi:hypothetical protein
MIPSGGTQSRQLRGPSDIWILALTIASIGTVPGIVCHLPGPSGACEYQVRVLHHSNSFWVHTRTFGVSVVQVCTNLCSSPHQAIN